MGRRTRFLDLFLPDRNDYYRITQDQNENFEKIDRKLEEWDTGKEPAIIHKKSGFNLDKTDSYEENKSNKLATAKALYRLWQAMRAMTGSIELTWEAIRNKPLKFPPETHYHHDYANKDHNHDEKYAKKNHSHTEYASRSHTHDDRYYTQTKSDNKLNGLAGKKDGTFPLSSATKGNVYLLESTNKYYMCVKDYSSYYSISVPNENFIEMSVYENLNRLNNLHKLYLIYAGAGTFLNGTNIVLNIPSTAKNIIIAENNDGWHICSSNHCGVKKVSVNTFKNEGLTVKGETKYYYENDTIKARRNYGDWGDDICLIYLEY